MTPETVAGLDVIQDEPAVMESGESLHNQWAAAIDAAYDELASAEEAKKERDDRWKNVFVYKDKKDKRSRYYAYYYDDPETNKSYPYSDREEALNERNFAYEVGDIPLKNRVNEARANLIRLQRDYPEGALLPNPDQRVDPEPDATEQKEPMSIDEQIESIPSQVISKVQSQINSILQWNDKLQRARQTDRMFQGGGRYAWEVTGGVQPDFTRQMQVLDDFREKAANNGLDAEAILQRLGYEDPLQLKGNELDDAHAPTPTPPAEPEVMDEPAVMEEDAQGIDVIQDEPDKKNKPSKGFKGFEDPWAVMSPEDRKEANRLLKLSFKAFPNSPKQKKLSQQLKALLYKYGIGGSVTQQDLNKTADRLHLVDAGVSISL